ncbi:uncharacterized protein TNCV_3486301 [Trichonephila clavipes]|nr:uncharacterized protein TNCV_3486301 [Trichonephila clavipes]
MPYIEDWFEEDDYVKFEKTGSLGVLPGRKRKPVGTDTVEEVATDMDEKASSPIYSSASSRAVFTAEFTLGPVFFETLTPQGPKRCFATSSRYSELLQQQIILALHERQCLQTNIFMQDGATPHIGRQVKAPLSASLGDNRVISRYFRDAWPSYSPHLNSCDFRLWGFLKDRIYSGEIRTLPDLKANVMHHVAEIPPTRGLLATDHVILNHGQVAWTIPELAPPLLTTTPHQREDVSALDRFNLHRCPTRRVFSGTGLELVTRQATIRYLYYSATTATVPYGDITFEFAEETNCIRSLNFIEILNQLGKKEKAVCSSIW